MDHLKCEAFLTAVERGSLTAAAESLNYTQPGITRMIHVLEEEVGFPLLTRSKRGVIPTENGKLMIPVFREIVRAAHNAQERSSEIQGMLQGSLVIGSYFSISSLILPPLIAEFNQAYPHIKIKLREGGNQHFADWIREKSVDFCFSAKPRDDLSCDWIPIFRDEQVVWVSSENPLSQETAFPVRQLEGTPFVQTLPGGDTEFDRMFQTYHVTPDVRFTTKDAYTTFCLVEANLGISFNQRLISKNWKGNVVSLPFDPPQYVELGLLVPNLKEASPAARRFMELIQKHQNEWL